MTTGRINQVTTEPDRTDYDEAAAAADQSESLLETLLNAEPQGFARRSFLQDSRNTQPVRLDRRLGFRRRISRRRTAFSVRLPNTPCEVGIFKTVEFI
jgi:hypothetical protein